jgi:hypothetical protein
MDGHSEGEEEEDKFLQFPIVFLPFFILFPASQKFPEEMNNLPIIMTSAKRQEAVVVVAMLRRRRRRGRTRKWENIGGVNRVQAIVRRTAMERPSAKLDPVVPAADAKRLGRHLLQSITK